MDYYHGNNLRDFLELNGHVVLQRVNNNYNLRSFTEKEIEHITNGYSTLLGKGAFADVYRGVLDGQHLVAVKKYKDGTRTEQFAKEVIVHSQINHKNVVRLFGCCTEESALTIVMEFICNGNLTNILHCSNANGHVCLPLDKRLNIAIELAEVISYMHSMYSPTLHGDIKPDNILLDENLAPKISDFGISRLLSSNGIQQTKNIIGSIGYLDPLYSQTGTLTPKSDVYSFGVVLVEIITRKKAADGNTCLIQNFSEALKRGKKVRQMFDEQIVDGKKSIKVLDDIAKLAAKCLGLEDKLRPEMVEVADRLRRCRKDLQHGARGATTSPSAPTWSAGGNYLSTQPPAPTPMDAIRKKQPTQVPAISMDELKEITGNFSNEILVGKGSHARVYHGELKDGRKSAVKMLHYPNFAVKELIDKEFLLQVQDISRLEHNNVVQLLGYCVEENTRALIYEYSSRGSLHDILHGKMGFVGAQPESDLSWAQRVNIALSSAEGLEYIHEKGQLCITHRIIQSSNILLFNNDVAKIIWDPELVVDNPHIDCPHPNAFYSDIDNYAAPECIVTGQLSNKSDTYSFGIVLLEILTGRKANDPTQPHNHPSLVSWAKPRLGRGKVLQCVDPRLGGEYPPKDVAKMAAIASRCMEFEVDSRPSMSMVVEDLRLLMQSLSS